MTFIEGFRQVRDLKTPIDPDRPELGPKANQLIGIGGRDDGKTEFAQRFVLDSFGSVNFYGHTGICGGSRRVAFKAFCDTWDKKPHMKPDYMGSQFVIYFGTAPGQAGNPYQPMARKSALGSTEKELKFVRVDPVLTAGLDAPPGGKNGWIAIKPGTDGALAMGMIRWIFENECYNAMYLENTTKESAKKKGFPSWTNATYLVVVDEKSPSYGKLLRAHEIGLAPAEAKGATDGAEASTTERFVVIDKTSGKPSVHDRVAEGVLFYDGTVKTADGREVRVKTSLQILKDNAFRYSLDEYAEACGVSVETITWLADEFTSHGSKAATDHHGGACMHANGFYNSLSIIMLNALIGNVNRKGGLTLGCLEVQGFFRWSSIQDKKLPREG